MQAPATAALPFLQVFCRVFWAMESVYGHSPSPFTLLRRGEVLASGGDAVQLDLNKPRSAPCLFLGLPLRPLLHPFFPSLVSHFPVEGLGALSMAISFLRSGWLYSLGLPFRWGVYRFDWGWGFVVRSEFHLGRFFTLIFLRFFFLLISSFFVKTRQAHDMWCWEGEGGGDNLGSYLDSEFSLPSPLTFFVCALYFQGGWRAD